MKITLHAGKTPTKPGLYLFQSDLRVFGPDLMRVAMVPEHYYGGIKFGPYLGVSNEGGRSVENYQGYWSEELTFED